MSVPHSTARWLAPAAFAYDLVAQVYGMSGTPNMKDVHDANLSFFSPQPMFIAAFFSVQQLFQLGYLYRLFASFNARSDDDKDDEVEQMVDYAPYYALGNVCIGTWMFFWNASSLKTSNFFVLVNTVAQLYYVFGRLRPMDASSTTSLLTHVVAKTFAGIGVLDLLHNTSVAYFKDAPAYFVVQILTGVGFGLGSAVSDWIFGGCLVYDLVALAVGQEGWWRTLLGLYAVGAAGIVAARNLSK